MWNTKKTINVDVWDDLIQNTYGKPYSFQQQDGCKDRGVYSVDIDYVDDFENDTLPYEINGDEMGVSFKAWLDCGSKEYENIFWKRNFYPDVNFLAKDLYEKGLISEKSFDIIVDW